MSLLITSSYPARVQRHTQKEARTTPGYHSELWGSAAWRQANGRESETIEGPGCSQPQPEEGAWGPTRHNCISLNATCPSQPGAMDAALPMGRQAGGTAHQGYPGHGAHGCGGSTQGSKGQWSRPRGRRIREVFLEEVAGNGGWRGERRRQNSPGGREGRVKTRR